MNRRAIRLIPVALAFAAVLSMLAPPSATADEISDKQAQAAQLDAQINAAEQKLGDMQEQINDAQVRLDEAKQQIQTADALVAAAQARTKQLRTEVAHRAAAVYTQSGSTGGVQVLDAQNAQDLSTKQKYSSLAAQRDKSIVNQLARAKEQLAQRKAEAEQARQNAQQQHDAIESQYNQLNDGKAKLQTLQSQVKGEIAVLVQKAEEERLAREKAAAQAAFAQMVQQAQAAAANSGGGTSSGGDVVSGGGGGGGGGVGATPPPTSGGVSAVINYAYAQLGKPYCYGGAGPDCFDCSGLSMMAWAQAGVYMPHGSYAQQAMFPAVSMDQLQPGDLVFWPSHVGIYIGNGSVIHAPHTGTVVQITPIWDGTIGAARPG
jgi:cell wall-associated NlpC family hydrolase